MDNLKTTSTLLFRQAGLVGLITGMLYMFSVLAAHNMGFTFSAWTLWSFRLSMIIGCIAAVVSLRIKQNGYITYPQGFLIAITTAILMGIIISLFTYVYQTYINPEYQTLHKEIYYRGLELEGWTKEQATRQLEGPWAFYFTTKGSMVIDILSSITWGFMIAITIGFMARRVPKSMEK